MEDAVNAGFAAGLFSFSEIVFEANHKHAAFRIPSFAEDCAGMVVRSYMNWSRENGVHPKDLPAVPGSAEDQ